MEIYRFRLLADFKEVQDFLKKNYDTSHLNSYYLPHFFEYAMTHPLFSHAHAHRMMIIKDNNQIIGFVGYEMTLGDAFLVIDPQYRELLPKMLILAENEISVIKDHQKVCRIWVIDHEQEKIKTIVNHGYSLIYEEAVTIFDYKQPFIEKPLPEGYSILSLEQENDLAKIDACMWKGFDHDGEPDGDLDGRLIMQTGPSFSKSLTTVIKAPNKDYACYAGMWFDEVNHYAYLEPLATTPDHRKRGLATIALMEAMKKTKACGALYCFGGDMPFYYALGFKKIATRQLYERRW